MSKSRRKPSITVAKVAAGYGLRVGASRVRVFRTKEEAVDAAKELARSGQGTFRTANIPSGSSRSFATTTTAKRVVRTHSGTTSSSKARPDSGESDLNRKDHGGKHPDQGKIEVTVHAPAARAWVTTEVAQYMSREEAKSRRKGVLSGLGAVAGLMGSIAAAVASILKDAVTSPGLDTTLFLGVASVAVAVMGILTAIIPGLLRSRTKTNAWAAKVAGVVWDDEMAGTGEVVGRY